MDRQIIKRFAIGTILSVLVFFSTSFVTVLFHINSPINRQIDDSLYIGFPFTYYSQFFIEEPIPNSGWKLNNLLLDIVITWIIVTGIYLLSTKVSKK